MDDFKNIKEAAKQIGVSAKTLRRYCIKRLIVFSLTAGGHYRFRQSGIDLFLSQHRPVKPTDKRKRAKHPKLPSWLTDPNFGVKIDISDPRFNFGRTKKG